MVRVLIDYENSAVSEPDAIFSWSFVVMVFGSALLDASTS
jgi:hypothetical protein